MTMGKGVLFYVGGHGFGHAARSAEVVRLLTARGRTVWVRTTAPARFFSGIPGVFLEHVCID
ncbi:MAG: hypothetical protein QHJ73_12720, partial [Armatimonadota bacterium]|nr:hypothetical protein [Armatimonadota bacterium]